MQCTQGLKQIDETGGFFLWAQEGDSADRYALGLVYGKDRHYNSPEGSYEGRSSRIRYGFAGANELRDYSVFTVNPRPCVRPGSCFFWRNYFVVGTFAEVVRRSSSLVKSADYGLLNVAEEASPLLPYVLSEDPLTGQNVLNPQDEADGGRPDALLYAWPVEKSLPLILMRDTQANKLFVSVDPYINSATVPFENPYKPGDEKHQRYQNRLCYRQYEGTEYIRLLGFVLTKDCITGDKTEYAPLSSVLDDEEYCRLPEALADTVLVERWRMHCDAVTPHSCLDYRPAAPEAIRPWAPRSAMEGSLNYEWRSDRDGRQWSVGTRGTEAEPLRGRAHKNLVCCPRNSALPHAHRLHMHADLFRQIRLRPAQPLAECFDLLCSHGVTTVSIC